MELNCKISVISLNIGISMKEYNKILIEPKRGEPYYRTIKKSRKVPQLAIDVMLFIEQHGNINLLRVNDLYSDGTITYMCISVDGMSGVLINATQYVDSFKIPSSIIRIGSTHAEKP